MTFLCFVHFSLYPSRGSDPTNQPTLLVIYSTHSDSAHIEYVILIFLANAARGTGYNVLDCLV